MNLRTLLIALTLAALAVFALLNWAAFTAPTALTLGFADVQAPLGLIMLVATGLVSALFLVYIVLQQAGVILEARRYAKELKAHRELADTAEASRFTELRSFLDQPDHYPGWPGGQSGQRPCLLPAGPEHVEQRRSPS